MVYDPQNQPETIDVSRIWNELREIRDEFERSQVSFLEFEQLNVAPAKPKDGRVYYADGTNWNPGSGKGLYFYDGSYNKL